MEHHSGLHRRNFISTRVDDIPMDTIRLVSPINRFAIFQGNFSNDDDDYPEKPYKLRTKVVIAALAVLVLVSALSGYFIGSSEYHAWKNAVPPDPLEPLPPSPSWLHTFQKAAVCTDAPHCSDIVETMGSWGLKARQLVKELSARLIEASGDKKAGNSLCQRISLAIQRGNVASILGTVPMSPQQKDIFYRHILSINGSAVDAAIAAMFCNGILNQQSMGLGGGFFMTVYIKAEERGYVVNAREKAPAAATRDMYVGSRDKASKGPLAVGVPGELRGMWAAHQHWGRLPWKSLVTPSLEFCKYGFPISKVLYDGMDSAPYIKNDPLLGKVYTTKGRFHTPGTIVKPPAAFCNTLQIIAEKGGDELYNGSLATTFAEDLSTVGSIITADDLRNYQAEILDPVSFSIGNGDVLYAPPPPSSGVVLGYIMNILQGYNFDANSINNTDDKILTYHRIVEAFKFAYAMRSKLGDTNFLDLKEMLTNISQPDFGDVTRLKINDSRTSNDSATYGVSQYSQPDSGTAHISIIAENGDAVSITSSINYYYGAGFSTLNTGIIMNNVMDDFSSPGFENYFGLQPSPANFIAPGKRPMSSMSPSILVDRNGNAKVVIGASGGTKITSAVALVIMRKLWFDQTIKEAVDEARFHHQIFPMEIQYEYGVIEDVVKGLRAKGHGLTRYAGRGSIVCALFRNRTGIYANADFRKGGDVAGID